MTQEERDLMAKWMLNLAVIRTFCTVVATLAACYVAGKWAAM